MEPTAPESNYSLAIGLLIVGLVLGGLGGYFYADMMAAGKDAAQETQTGADENPYAQVETDPYADVKVNPFE